MRIKDILVVYLPQRIIVFPFHLYIDSFIYRILNRMNEWNLINDKKITGKEKYFKFFVEKEIIDILLEIKIVYKNLNIKIFTIYKDLKKDLECKDLLEDQKYIINFICKQFKKICKKYFSDKISSNLNFIPSTTTFKNLKCGDPTGEEIEFLTKLI